MVSQFISADETDCNFSQTSQNIRPKIKTMKTIILGAILSLSSIAPSFADGTNAFGDDKAKDSYAIGMMLGHNWQQQGVDVDLNWVARGLKDGQAGSSTLMTPQDVQNTLKEFQQAMVAKHAQMQAEQGSKNKTDGAAFLAANKSKPGVVTLPDGLQYKVITDGTGVTPTPNSVVTVNYRGTFIDGTEFDSSYKRGQPAQFPIMGVIHGWTEALLQMKVGSKWQLFIPSDLAYGEQGRPPIPPNSVLVFEVELVSAQAQNQPPVSSVSPIQPLTSDIIKVPSAAEMKNGAKIEVIKPEDVQKMQAQAQTN
jgi:FKBP-type peptidyl-prolyl cis-trans isomerase FklB